MADPTASGYRRSVDLARFLAAFGIVWDHARAPFADIGYLALSLFLVLTSYLAVGSYLRSDRRGFWLSRARRIAVPWLFWCVIFRVIYEVVSHAPFALLSEPGTLLIGPSIHLWFLSFVMIALVFIAPMCRLITGPRQVWAALAGLLVLSLPLGLLHAEVAPTGWFISAGPFPQPLPQWFYSLPLFLFGAMLALAQRQNMIWAPVAVSAVVSGVLYLMVPAFASIQMVLVAVLFLAVWQINITGQWPTMVASYAFGIYLLHPAMMLVAFKLFGADVDRSFGALFSFFGSWALTWGLQRFPVLRRFV